MGVIDKGQWWEEEVPDTNATAAMASLAPQSQSETSYVYVFLFLFIPKGQQHTNSLPVSVSLYLIWP